MKKILLSSLLLNLLTACATDCARLGDCTIDVRKEEVKVPATPAPAIAPAKVATKAVAQAALTDTRSVFYPVDVDTVQPSDLPVVQAHGKYLAKSKNAKVRVEGNADERGSSEYNLSLGQRRANNVKKLLILSGAKASQIETVSFGEEKPRAIGHDEASWSQNRRTDIVAK